ncbi:hypothetical protein BN1708_019955, partial [Verticillium longisporum]
HGRHRLPRPIVVHILPRQQERAEQPHRASSRKHPERTLDRHS